jgi:glucokinase-like ROK family protein
MKDATADKTLIRKINLTLILKLIREQAPISRASIAKQLKLNPATVSSNVKILLEENLIREVGSGVSSGGRRPILLEINESARFAIGVDVQKDKVVVAAVDLDGMLVSIKEIEYQTHFSKEIVLSTIYNAIDVVMDDMGYDRNSYYGIGVGMHGIVDVEKGISLFAPAFSWHNVHIAELLEKRYRLSVKIDNDARAMALGEKWFGAAGKVDNFIFLNIGSGIGSGIFISGSLYRGFGGAAGEIGHIKVKEGGKQCVCGSHGCLDTVASTNAILEMVEDARKNDVASYYAIHFPDVRKLSINEVAIAARNKDSFTLELLKEIGKYLGIAVSSALMVMNPEMVVIGGEISAVMHYFLPTFEETLFKYSLKECQKGLKVIPSALADQIGVVGASTLIIQRVFKGPVVQ